MHSAEHAAIQPHPSAPPLRELMAPPDRRAELRAASPSWVAWPASPRQLCDLDLLMTGAFSPLTGFLGQADHRSVCERMRLADGTLWPMPIMLDVSEAVARRLDSGVPLALRDAAGELIAVLHVEEVWRPDRHAEALAVFRTTSRHHPGVAHLLDSTNPWYVGGRIEGVRRPGSPDFGSLRPGPAELRAEFAELGWDRVVAFHTRNPMHRAHFELTRRAASEADAKLLLHPVVGMTKPDDVDPDIRVRCYHAILPRYPEGSTRLALIPMAMRMSGPRDSLWNAIIRRNFGCTHYIVGRDHASPGGDADGRPFYGPYEAQEILFDHESELGIHPVPFPALVYVPKLDRYLPVDEVPAGFETQTVSGTYVRSLLARGEPIPGWITFPEVAAELRSLSLS
jgi:sulfate adenylyltransferase